MTKIKEELIDLLTSRLYIAEKFSKDYNEDVKKWLRDYNIDSIGEFDHKDIGNKIQIPYIFSTIESGLPTMFERVPTVLIKQRGVLDKDLTSFMGKIWDYVVEKTKLEDKTEDVGLYMLLTGMGGVKFGWVVETEEIEETETVPITNEDGSPVAEQEVVNKVAVPVRDEPFVEVLDYNRINFAPESRFVQEDEENRIPYIVCKYTKTPDEVEFEYGAKVDEKSYLNLKDIDESMDKDDKQLLKTDLERVDVFEYYGNLPKKHVKSDSWKPNKVYYTVFTRTKVLKKPEEFRKKPFVFVGNYGDPLKFHKFGEPRIMRELEQDISLGRSRIMDYRDKYGTKVWLPKGVDVDENALKNPADFVIMRGISKETPMYITPPPLPETIIQASEMSRADIQMVSAQLDLARGSTQSVVKTATGQQIFQQATEKRIDRKRRKIAKFLKYLAKNLLVLCGENWDEEKLHLITDIPMEEIVEKQYLAKLKEVGNMYDIEIDVESVTNNKETMSAQAIALYREVKEDELINRTEVLKEALKVGFGIRDAERFLSQNVDPETIMKVLGYLVDNQMMDPNQAQQMALALRQLMQPDGKETGGAMGRPETGNPTDVQKDRQPPADNTQVTSQNTFAGKQVGIPKGMQNIGG